MNFMHLLVLTATAACTAPTEPAPPPAPVADGCDAPGAGLILSPDGPASANLKAAVADAARGAVLTLCPGSYEANLLIERDLHLRAAPGVDPALVILTAPARAPTLHVRGASLTLTGLTVRGGLGAPIDGVLHGGGLLAEQGASVLATGVTFEGGAAQRGGSIAMLDSAIGLTDVVVQDGLGSEAGGGLYLDGSEAVLLDAVIMHNRGGTGGAVAAVASTVQAARCTLTANDATQGGGLAAWGEARVDWSEGEISHNRANVHGGGMWASGSGTMVALANTLLRHDDASHSGGGAWVGEQASLAVHHGSVRDNEARDGGGIAAERAASISLVAVEVVKNRAERDGAGLLVRAARLHAQESTLSDNGPFDPVPGLEHHGGGLAGFDGAEVELDDVLLVGNAATFGGGLHLTASTLRGTSLVLRKNRATRGAIADLVAATVDLVGIEATEHQAVHGGLSVEASTLFDLGGHYADNGAFTAAVLLLSAASEVTLHGTRMERNHNTEPAGAAVQLEGGAVLRGTTLDLGEDADDNTPGDVLTGSALRWTGARVHRLECRALDDPWCTAEL